MSLTADDACKDVRTTCESCRNRSARVAACDRMLPERPSTLCFECFRSERGRRRARGPGAIPPAAPLRDPGSEPRPLSDRQRAHRRRMLAHLVAGGR